MPSCDKTEYLYINDNAGTINSKMQIALDIFGGKHGGNEENFTYQEFFDRVSKKFRKIEDTPESSAKENLRLSLKIAKKNVEIDKENKYYLGILERVQTKWNSLYA